MKLVYLVMHTDVRTARDRPEIELQIDRPRYLVDPSMLDRSQCGLKIVDLDISTRSTIVHTGSGSRQGVERRVVRCFIDAAFGHSLGPWELATRQGYGFLF